jgi:hypothetical protein
LRLEELQLAVEKLEMRLGEDNLREIVLAGATTDISGFGGGIFGIVGLRLSGVVVRHLRGHSD